ncbi:hypothetical protein TNIN_479251 [Trichonephila inaurata madagascariensis]|uniref:Uncharacterized protein n=1 Tax=Trichonephila inaurata madagascariensis TaxID=2747483 RepID=A0A8X7C478_9ARAC|nr:hypothetical protein TNIN_479251 [Trichonephila inaurata madagascariensis]
MQLLYLQPLHLDSSSALQYFTSDFDTSARYQNHIYGVRGKYNDNLTRLKLNSVKIDVREIKSLLSGISENNHNKLPSVVVFTSVMDVDGNM